MAPSKLLVAALICVPCVSADEDTALLQAPLVAQTLQGKEDFAGDTTGDSTDESECRCPGYYQDQCEAEHLQGCRWSSEGSSNGPWCQCLGPDLRGTVDSPAEQVEPNPVIQPQPQPQPEPQPQSQPQPTLAPATASATACPAGWEQAGGAGADISGCGLQSCEERYETTSESSCAASCDDNDECVAFSYAPMYGDQNHESMTVCTLYDSASPTEGLTVTGSAGAVQVFCARPAPAPPPAVLPAVCPVGWSQVGEAGADISGCGLQSCEERYTATSVASCAASCDASGECVAFSYAPLHGDQNHESMTVCTLYDSDSPTEGLTVTGSAGAVQVFCTQSSACPPSFEVLSNDHAHGVTGKYFNFDLASAAESLGRSLVNGEELWAWSEQFGGWREVMVWTAVNGGSDGDGHGRLHPYDTASQGDWDVGDHLRLALTDGVDVLSVDHVSGTTGWYFNFDVASAAEALGRRLQNGEVLWAMKQDSDIWRQIIVWTSPNGGSSGDGHGRLDPFQSAAIGDWAEEDHLILAHPPTVEVLSVDHSSGSTGKYFNFNQVAAAQSLGRPVVNGEVLWALSSRVGAQRVIVWTNANGGSSGDAHGRLDTGAAGGDWETGDSLGFVSSTLSPPYRNC